VFNNIYEYLGSAEIYSAGMITILILTGFAVGFINTIAGMASALSYALFMAMGMPINVANGTTRIGIIAQFTVSSTLFKKQGLLDVNLAWRVGIPVTIGSIIGAQLAAVVNPRAMEITMGIVLPIMAVLLLLNQKKEGRFRRFIDNNSSQTLTPFKFFVFLFIGIYGGFTHAGVGILLIFGSIFLFGMDMLKANGIKQFAVLMYTPLALFIFIKHGQVNWPVAIIFAIGNVSGATVASLVAIKWGVKIINYLVATAVFTMSFWLIYKQFI